MTLGNEFRLRVYNLKKRQKVTYTSSNEQVISVNNVTPRGKNATITALSTGSATISATVKKAKKVVRKLKCRIKVSPNAFSIKFPKRKIRLGLFERCRLDPIIKPNTSTEQPIFESDDPAVVSVSCRGIVTALTPGKAKITATLLSSGITATCTVDVYMPPSDAESKPSRYEKKQLTQLSIE